MRVSKLTHSSKIESKIPPKSIKNDYCEKAVEKYAAARQEKNKAANENSTLTKAKYGDIIK